MIDRRDILVGSATALTASFLTPSPALAQATTVPGTKRGFLERPGCRIYYEVTGSGPPIISTGSAAITRLGGSRSHIFPIVSPAFRSHIAAIRHRARSACLIPGSSRAISPP